MAPSDRPMKDFGQRRLNNGRGSITERPYSTLIPASPFNASSADLSSRTAKLSKPHWRMWLS